MPALLQESFFKTPQNKNKILFLILTKSPFDFRLLKTFTTAGFLGDLETGQFCRRGCFYSIFGLGKQKSPNNLSSCGFLMWISDPPFSTTKPNSHLVYISVTGVPPTYTHRGPKSKYSHSKMQINHPEVNQLATGISQEVQYI